MFAAVTMWSLLVTPAAALGGENTAATAPLHISSCSHAVIPQELAAQYLRSGRKREAAVLYEEVARTNISARKVLSHRLVALYSETGEAEKALQWAREVMRDNPDPLAYLAGVHARLGRFREAQTILERELAGNTNRLRAVTLRWQLADIFQREGDRAIAQKLLKDAAEASRGTPLEAIAEKRLTTADAPQGSLGLDRNAKRDSQ